jgi:hypothetical protein
VFKEVMAHFNALFREISPFLAVRGKLGYIETGAGEFPGQLGTSQIRSLLGFRLGVFMPSTSFKVGFRCAVAPRGCQKHKARKKCAELSDPVFHLWIRMALQSQILASPAIMARILGSKWSPDPLLKPEKLLLPSPQVNL